MQITFEVSRNKGRHLIRVVTPQQPRQVRKRKFDYCAPCDAKECGGVHEGLGCLTPVAEGNDSFICLCAWDRSTVGSNG